jgi:hypothetical protein
MLKRWPSMKNKNDLEAATDHLSAAFSHRKPVEITEDEQTGDRFLLYIAEDGVRAEFRFQDETLWMTQAQIAEFFDKDRSVITKHINNILLDLELVEESNVQKVHIARSTKPVSIYSLDMVISVGYRVTQSRQATLLRRWATTTLVNFATSGFVVDKKRLSDSDNFDRLKELREIIRDIRASEANVYREIRGICAMCQDYDGSSKQARNFYAAVQNKLLWSVASQTAPEIIVSRADARQPNMGLQTWTNENIRKADVTIAHNYLSEAEIREKNRFTVMLLDFFEDRVDIGKLTTMAQAEAELDKFIQFNDRALLSGKGRMSRVKADKHAQLQYVAFAETRRKERLV